MSWLSTLIPNESAFDRNCRLHGVPSTRFVNWASNLLVMPLNFPLDLEEDTLLTSLFLIFFTILNVNSDKESKDTERNRLAFIYTVYRFAHPSSTLYTEEELNGMIKTPVRDINKRARKLAIKVHKNLSSS